MGVNINEYLKKRYYTRRKQAISYLGGKCVRCASDRRLELDHIDKTTKEFDIGKFWGTGLDRFWKEVAKCQLLCKRCHMDKTNVENGKKLAVGTHGTVSSYRYCKCESCRSAQRDYIRRYRAERKELVV